MDAPEEELDIKLQKISGDLIADFDRSLVLFLRKPDRGGAGGLLVVRPRVRSRETERLVSSLLDPFQEVPQLLDPHLPKWLPILADAFLEYTQTKTKTHRRRGLDTEDVFSQTKSVSTRSELLMPLPAAISRILYTLCKIRGEKVIVHFLSNETKYLELFLSALEDSERNTGNKWTWEERYVVLLWLSHLMLAPFDLATISSSSSSTAAIDGEDDGLPRIRGFEWPTTRNTSLPGITTRVLPCAIKYLASPGKERDAAKALLVRLSMRRDMQELGVLDALVNWALGQLRPSVAKQENENETETERTPYHYIGVLSFLSGILVSSSDTSDMDRYLSKLFYTVHSSASASADDESSNIMFSSALARKTGIKVIRAIAVLTLRNNSAVNDDMTSSMELVETTIGFFLENLADNDTPVRFAASKALSIITLKLDADMASQVVEAVIESLSRNVLWIKDPTAVAGRRKDLSAVNPLEWHGLMLTLSHLLYRRSPPASNLPDIVHALIMGLSFERRSASGTSVGTNVRDAACFGIWALARRYSTAELLAVRLYKTSSSPSVLQILATELVIAASLDPAGNIRRGSSAALQELVGRHPDTVEKGIWLVQAVDYHSVALRSRALREVALGATKLADQYGEAILDALLGWRGVGDVDAAARRAAGLSFGKITAELANSHKDPVQRLARSVSLVLGRLRALQVRQVEERHGLVLSLAAVLDSLPGVVEARKGGGGAFGGFVQTSIAALVEILADCQTKTYRRPELIAEAVSRLIISAFPVLQAASFDDAVQEKEEQEPWNIKLVPGPVLVTDRDNAGIISSLVDALYSTTTPVPDSVKKVVHLAHANLSSWLVRSEDEVLAAASDAALVTLVFSGKTECESIVREWVTKIRQRPSGVARGGSTAAASGYFSALTKTYQVVRTLALPDEKLIAEAINERWRNDKVVDTHVAILQSLTQTDTLKYNVGEFIGLIEQGLDDYYTNARGDVGSLVRLQAIRATRWLWEECSLEGWPTVVSRLFLKILRLSAEKLDRVRVEGQATLAVVLKPEHATKLRKDTFSSRAYFCFLLDLLSHDWLDNALITPLKANPEKWMEELLVGLVSSADTGNEELVIATRAALCDFCETSPSNVDAVCAALVRNLKSQQTQDRVLVPTLEVVAFLFHVGIFTRCRTVDYKKLCLQVQKAAYKTGNVRKIEACVRVYGAIAGLLLDEDKSSSGQSGKTEGIKEARRRLGALMLHPWPRVRSLVVDELWGLSMSVSGETPTSFVADAPAEQLKGVDWGKAEKGAVKTLVASLRLD
ncbi:tubulin folding cofactor D C terminal-domain-containing protein [Apodospora peruviana]|uniref:Tubulin folding cofactor D C terminal-domain-containing protein n=1 Tax=Apodospora peruviana TaxID=516989 RepID=A0AAE0HTP3_9PEZI|nr:tubulin folding cofactor D C terminal-domain-containing protein [Apodospora peruviana]